MYSLDNNDWLAANGLPSPMRKIWVQGVFYDPPARTNVSFLIDPRYALFAEYLRTRHVYVCPADAPSISLWGHNYPRVRSYGLNAYLGWIGPWEERLSRARIFNKKGQLAVLALDRILTFADVQADSICWPFFGIETRQEIFFNFPGSAHGGAGVLAFADGHARAHRWADSRTVLARSTDYHAHLDRSPANRDLVWLRERATAQASPGP